MRIHLMAILAGFLLDLCLGDPYGLPHPVRAIGRWITDLEHKLRMYFPKNEKGELTGGIGLVMIIIFMTGSISMIVCAVARTGGTFCLFAVETVMSYYCLAARSLYRESMKVHDFLKCGEIENARKNVSMIVGRDTASLSSEGIAKAAVETVAENTSDGVIAPLFYMAIGEPVLGWIYKAINTMDSMVGYKNESYLYFGRAAARVDDFVNFIPARLSAILMIGASALLRMHVKDAIRIYKRDRFNHKSPNSAQTEAVCAGALGVQLAGDAWYFGTLCKKQVIGDDLRPIEYQDIKRAGKLMYLTAILCLLLITGLLLSIN